MIDCTPVGILIRRKFVASIKNRKHGGADEPVIVLWPLHVRHGHHVVNLPMQKGPPGFMELGAELEAAQLQRPPRCSIAPGPPGPAVLVRVQNYHKAKGLAPLDHLPKIVQVLLIILENTFVLHCLPGKQKSNQCVAPGPKSGQMGVQLPQRRRATHEGHVSVASVKIWVFGTCERRRLQFRDSGELSVAAEIHSPGKDQPAFFIFPSSLDPRLPGQIFC
mmetsp:Transcript_94587/g.216392  ORF Transcript_94587/g.216392 Transcript_94587/m.216392 type:complete len:220 (-) Transcript_94587:55-714(-)